MAALIRVLSGGQALPLEQVACGASGVLRHFAFIGGLGVFARFFLIRPLVETEENIGKLITIDVETGDYEITTWLDSARGSDKLLARHPDAELIQIRIGYPVVDTFGGIRLMPGKRA